MSRLSWDDQPARPRHRAKHRRARRYKARHAAHGCLLAVAVVSGLAVSAWLMLAAGGWQP